MSTATPHQVATSYQTSLSETICSLLSTLLAGRRDGALICDGRTPDGIDPGRTIWIRADQAGAFLPTQLLTTLEEGTWSLHVRVAVRRQPLAPELARLGALVVSWRVSTDARTGRIDHQALTAVEQRIQAFALAPTAVIHGGHLDCSGFSATTIYGLVDALDVRTSATEAQALDLLRRLARALGATVPATDVRLGDLSLPLVGSTIREGTGRDVVVCSVLDTTRRYSSAAIETAIQETAP